MNDSNEKSEMPAKFKRFKSKNKDKKEKFVPNFKKKIPTWKQIDSEIVDILPKYDEVTYQFERI
jgi:hypothetical protein